jgi:hypothetical protein
MDLLKQQEKYWWIRFTILKADGSSDSTTYSNLGEIGTAGIARFKSGGGRNKSNN